MLTLKTVTILCILTVLFSVTITETSISLRREREKRSNCKPLWNNKCSKDKDCCSKNCQKENPNWTYGFCGPSKADLGPPNECKPLWFSFCKQHGDCCSKNCVKEKKWSYGYCSKGSGDRVDPVPIKDKDDTNTDLVPIEDEDDTNTEPETCGVRKAKRVGGRIVGGSPAIRNEFPWQVGIELNEVIRGGGAIIDERWILTASHVFTSNSNLDNYRGIIGTVSIDEAPIYVFFDKLIIHPQFNNSNGDYNNDIALLHTTKEMPLYPKWDIVNSVCLPEPNAEFTGIVTVSGWGNIDDEGTPADRLMAVDLQIQKDETCKKEYANLFNTTTMICAGKPNGGKDSCLGDSGGPLVHFEQGFATVVGIVSFGPKDRSCGKKGSVAVYTKVSKYIDWIERSYASSAIDPRLTG